MPMYPYECDHCGHKDDEFQKMSADHLTLCPKCGVQGAYQRRVALIHTPMQEYHTPIEMHSIGCTSVEQIREMQAAGVTISDDPQDPLYGTPIARSRHEKLKALKTAGYVETK